MYRRSNAGAAGKDILLYQSVGHDVLFPSGGAEVAWAPSCHLLSGWSTNMPRYIQISTWVSFNVLSND